jgi:hypothetical protein
MCEKVAETRSRSLRGLFARLGPGCLAPQHAVPACDRLYRVGLARGEGWRGRDGGVPGKTARGDGRWGVSGRGGGAQPPSRPLAPPDPARPTSAHTARIVAKQ